MRIKKDISAVRLQELKAAGWSHQRLAIHFAVSKATIKRRFREIAGEKDKTIMELARGLEDFGRSAPPGYCRNEIMRLVNQIRLLHAIPDDTKKRQILASIESGAREVEEIAEDCHLAHDEALRLLEALISENRIYKRSRGGIRNRGRRQKMHYFLMPN